MNRKTVTFSVITLISILLGYYGYHTWDTSRRAEKPRYGGEALVVREDFIESIKVNGKARLAHEQKLRFSQGGKVASVNVNPGDTVKKGALLASLDTTEYVQSMRQAQDRFNLARTKLQSAQAKIGGLEFERMNAELLSLEKKRSIIQQDLQKLIRNAPLQSEIKNLEKTEKESQIKTREAAHKVNLALWQNDTNNKSSLISKKKIDAQKIITSTIQDINADFTELNTIRNGINKIFGFDYTKLSNEERTDASYVAYNVPGLRAIVESAWRDTAQIGDDIQQFALSIEGKEVRRENAVIVNDLFLTGYTKMLDVVEKTLKALEKSDVYEVSLSRAKIDTLKNTTLSYRNTLVNKIQIKKDNKNLFPIIASDELIIAQVEKELAERKQVLDTEKLAIEKLKLELANISAFTESGSTLNLTVRREIDSKKQELLDIDISISGKKIDISKQAGGKSDEIINLESELKQAELELEKNAIKREQYEIRAPIDGVIRSVKMLPGDTIIQGTNNSLEGTIIIEDEDAVLIVAKLSQKDIVRIRQNQEATIRLDAFPDITFTGSISELSSSPTENTNGGEATYEIQVLFSGGENTIYSGMSAAIEIFVSKKTGILFVPVTAINTDTTTGETYVNVITASGIDEKRIVSLGITNGDNVEVLDGVNEGEKIRTLDFSAEKFQNNMMF